MNGAMKGAMKGAASGNAAAWFIDRHVAEGRAAKVAFREAWPVGRELTCGDLSGQSGRLAAARAREGINREERAAMFVLDQIEFPVVFWGALKACVAPTARNTLLASEVYRRILADSRATIAFVSVELPGAVLPAAKASPHLRRIVVIGGTAPEGTLSWAVFMGGAAPTPARDCSGDDIAFWLYSSGWIGLPNGVRHVHDALRITCEGHGRQVLGIDEGDVVFSAAKLFFAYGLGNGMSFPLSVGATTLLCSGRPTPEAVSDVIAGCRPTIFCGVPTLYAALLQAWDAAGARPKAPIRTCISAGEALPAEIGRKSRAACGVDILDGVGPTEMLHIFLSNRPGAVEYGTSGVAVRGYELRLVDENGQEVGPRGIGELLVRGGSAAADYWNQRGKARATFQGEWTRTGDKYLRGEGGRFIYCGRTDDMFKVSGMWVSPFEIEQALIAYPPIRRSSRRRWSRAATATGWTSPRPSSSSRGATGESRRPASRNSSRRGSASGNIPAGPRWSMICRRPRRARSGVASSGSPYDGAMA